MRKPKISVILPVYNGEKFIKEAIDSILKQTFKNFECLVINDGSIDGTEQIINGIKDRRIKIITNKKNLGVAKSLNIGLRKATGEYIARCDSDDINLPNRFKKQMEYLNENKDYVLVGSSFDIINYKGKKIGEALLPQKDEEIRKKLVIRNPILHPSVIYRRKEVLKLRGYREIFNGAEDYDLWFRLLKLGKFYNLNEKLVKRRWHDAVVTKKSHIKVELLALLVRLLHFPSGVKYLI